MLRLSALLVCCSVVLNVESAGLKEEFTWTFINYAWPENSTVCGHSKDNMSGKGDFVFPSAHEAPKRGYFSFRNRNGVSEETPEYTLENNIPMGATRYQNKVFVTVPRRRVGIPSTLNYVSLDCKARHNVPLTPYPSWEMNALNADRPNNPTDVRTPFVSVYRTTVDACDRLWFVDMGMLEYPTGRQQVQQFALIVMDLKTDKVIRRFPFSVTDANPAATLASVHVDVTKDTCDDAFAYIPDLVNYKLLVYSWKNNDAWRISHNYFFLDPLQGDFSIGGHNFMWNDGIFSVGLSKIQPDGYRTAYFHAMASTREFSVSTRVLRNRDLATRSYQGGDFQVVGDRGKKGQTASHELHEQSGIMFMAEVNKNGLYCWNINKPLTPRNQGLVHADAQKMIYPSDVKLDNKNNVWNLDQ
ncbi:yellow-f2 [Carabus blaptoides fortunei]